MSHPGPRDRKLEAVELKFAVELSTLATGMEEVFGDV
jgi:hypothetical protein